MKPKNKIDLLDFDSLSTDEMGALIEALTAEHKERLNRDKRRRKAEEYETRIYDLICEAQGNGYTIRINNEIVDNAYDIEVEP